MTIWRPMRYVCVALPEELIIALDEASKASFYNRSEYIRRALMKATEKYSEEAIRNVMREDPLDPRLSDLDDS